MSPNENPQSITQSFCLVKGCERVAPNNMRGWCQAHYTRWWRTGETGAAEIRKFRSTCEVADCGQKHRALGLCEDHYYARRYYGEEIGDESKAIAENTPRWVGDNVSYMGVHTRLMRMKGHPDQFDCGTCGKPAKEWAYDHKDADEKPNKKGHMYSAKIEHYVPMCISCHRKADWANRKAMRAAELLAENVLAA